MSPMLLGAAAFASALAEADQLKAGRQERLNQQLMGIGASGGQQGWQTGHQLTMQKRGLEAGQEQWTAQLGQRQAEAGALADYRGRGQDLQTEQLYGGMTLPQMEQARQTAGPGGTVMSLADFQTRQAGVVQQRATDQALQLYQGQAAVRGKEQQALLDYKQAQEMGAKGYTKTSEYTPRQRQALADIDASIADIQGSPEWAGPTQTWALNEFNKRRRSIAPMEGWTKQPIPVEQQFKQRGHRFAGSNTYAGFDDSGKPWHFDIEPTEPGAQAGPGGQQQPIRILSPDPEETEKNAKAILDWTAATVAVTGGEPDYLGTVDTMFAVQARLDEHMGIKPPGADIDPAVPPQMQEWYRQSDGNINKLSKDDQKTVMRYYVARAKVMLKIDPSIVRLTEQQTAQVRQLATEMFARSGWRKPQPAGARRE